MIILSSDSKLKITLVFKHGSQRTKYMSNSNIDIFQNCNGVDTFTGISDLAGIYNAALGEMKSPITYDNCAEVGDTKAAHISIDVTICKGIPPKMDISAQIDTDAAKVQILHHNRGGTREQIS